MIEGSKLSTFDRDLDQSLERRADAQRLGDQLVMVAVEVEVEAEHHVERLAVEDADGQQVRGQLQDQLGAGRRRLRGSGVDVARGQPRGSIARQR